MVDFLMVNVDKYTSSSGIPINWPNWSSLDQSFGTLAVTNSYLESDNSYLESENTCMNPRLPNTWSYEVFEPQNPTQKTFPAGIRKTRGSRNLKKCMVCCFASWAVSSWTVEVTVWFSRRMSSTTLTIYTIQIFTSIRTIWPSEVFLGIDIYLCRLCFTFKIPF